MKLEHELVREVLLALEADDGDPKTWKDLDIPGFTSELIAYTVQILADGGLIEAVDLTTGDCWDWKPQHLTYQGHEYLNTIRDGEVWKRSKDIAGKVGSYSLQVLIAAGKTIIQQKLAEHGVHLT